MSDSPFFTLPGLRDLYEHMEWADAAVWTAALGSDAAETDRELIDRLHHVHSTQRAFLEVWTGQPIGKYYTLTFASLTDLFAWMQPYFGEVRRFLDGLDPARLAEPMPVPWARMFNKQLGREAAVSLLGETLFQVTSHSTYHRAQINTRLRALGTVPPLVDYIAWLWRGRPAPVWPRVA